MTSQNQAPIPDDILHYIEANQDLDLVYNLDVDREYIDVRPTMIYDVKTNSHLILAQTTPPIVKADEGRRVEITLVYRVMGTNEYQRWGFPATILVVLDRQRLTSGVEASMFLVSWPQTFRQTGVRMHHRIEPSASFKPMFFFAGPDEFAAHVLDISLGGMRVWTPPGLAPQTDQVLNLTAYLDKDKYAFKARVVRIISMGREQPTQLGLQFTNLPDEARKKLQSAIEAEYREERRRLSGLE
jgi:hypothetical protein